MIITFPFNIYFITFSLNLLIYLFSLFYYLFSFFLRIEILLKRKCDKLIVTWKGYNNSFISWIDKKDNVRIVNPNLLSMNEEALTHLLLYGDNTSTDNANTYFSKLYY